MTREETPLSVLEGEDIKKSRVETLSGNNTAGFFFFKPACQPQNFQLTYPIPLSVLVFSTFAIAGNVSAERNYTKFNMPKSKRAKVVHLSKVEKKGKALSQKIYDGTREAAEKFPYIFVLSVENMRTVYLQEVRSEFADSRWVVMFPFFLSFAFAVQPANLFIYICVCIYTACTVYLKRPFES